MEEYKYTFKYQNNDIEITSTFGASLNLYELKRRIREFLLACSWSEEQTKFLESEED